MDETGNVLAKTFMGVKKTDLTLCKLKVVQEK